MIRYVETTDQDLRAKQGQNGMDGYQYVLMVAGHIERHVQQMEEVKAASGLPAGIGGSGSGKPVVALSAVLPVNLPLFR